MKPLFMLRAARSWQITRNHPKGDVGRRWSRVLPACIRVPLVLDPGSAGIQHAAITPTVYPRPLGRRELLACLCLSGWPDAVCACIAWGPAQNKQGSPSAPPGLRSGRFKGKSQARERNSIDDEVFENSTECPAQSKVGSRSWA
jgi:hypothetical protein